MIMTSDCFVHSYDSGTNATVERKLNPVCSNFTSSVLLT